MTHRPPRPARAAAPTGPALLVLYDRGAAPPTAIRLAARGIGRPVFLGDLTDPRVAADLAALPRTAEVLDTSDLTLHQLSQSVGRFTPAGIVTFSDSRLRAAADLAERLGLPFHTPDTADLLVDKVRQRQALAAADVQATDSVPLRSAADLAPALAATGLPAVLKPRSGAGSVDTCLVRSADELAARFAEFTADRQPGPGYVLERYLAGDPEALGRFWGDYVSVESLVHEGTAHTVTVTGKLPLAPPFRETGMFVPAALPKQLALQVVGLEQSALRALGVRHGATHTEIKFTPDGPRIIEVNGRMGGHVADPLKRAAAVDLIALTLQLALGQCLPPAPLLSLGPRCPQVAYQFLLTPPDQDALPGDPALLDDLAELPGVSLVDAHPVAPGWHPDWRAGTEWLLGTVHGTAPDHRALRETVEQLRYRTAPFWHHND